MDKQIIDLIKILKSVESVGLILPFGWFGRPYDNFLSVKEIVFHDDHIIIYFDNKTIKIDILFAQDISFSKNKLLIGKFKSLQFEWIEYGANKQNVNTFDEGSLAFVARPLTEFLVDDL